MFKSPVFQSIELQFSAISVNHASTSFRMPFPRPFPGLDPCKSPPTPEYCGKKQPANQLRAPRKQGFDGTCNEGPDDITREMSAPAQGATGHRQRFPQGGIWMAKGTNDPQTAIPPALKFGWRKTRTGYGQNRQRRDRRLALRRSSARRGESLNRFSKLRQERGFPDCHSKSSTPNKRGPRLATRAGSPLRQWLYKKIYAPKY